MPSIIDPNLKYVCKKQELDQSKKWEQSKLWERSTISVTSDWPLCISSICYSTFLENLIPVSIKINHVFRR